MARNDKSDRANKRIQNIANGLATGMEDLYRSTYMTNPQQSKDLDDLNARINANIDNIVTRNMDMIGVPSVSRLYSRLAATGSDEAKSLAADLENLFNNGVVSDDLYSIFMSNRYLKELDMEIDTVCKYMPKLEEALAAQKDCVLSADHFSKDFLSFKTPSGGVSEDVFSERAKDIKRKYRLQRFIEETYENTSKYGEDFVYRVPYATAIGKLLATKADNPNIFPNRGLHESTDPMDGINESKRYVFSLDNNKCQIISEDGEQIVNDKAVVITESTKTKYTGETVTEAIQTPILQDGESFKINIELCHSNMIEEAVLASQEAYEKSININASSLYRIHEATVIREDNNSDIRAAGNIAFGDRKRDPRIITANDGLVPGEPLKPVKVKAPGCVIKRLRRDQVVPIYIEDVCMGYYYFELRSTGDSESFFGFKNILGDPLTNMRGDNMQAFNIVDTDRQDDTIRYVAGQLSSFIDKNFVNNNQDLAREIYMILKYNNLFNTPSVDLIKVTFIPPEDMVHFYFRLDPITHRGISDLDKSLIPAKIYSSLYVSSAIGNLTRTQDHRVYYVKQTVDTNIAQNLLNVIQQIKQGNFGIRQFQNINNILGIIGRFNDFVIPTNSSGDAPIQFEVMPGQEISIPTDLMESLEQAAVNNTGIPIEYLDTRNSVDYAMQITMSSSKVLRFAYKRQELFQDLLTEFITPIYNYEYNESCVIEVTLPPPSFINITNTNQLLDNTKNLAEAIAEMDFKGIEDDKLKDKYTKKLFNYYIGTHIDTAAHRRLFEEATLESKAETDESHSAGGESDY